MNVNVGTIDRVVRFVAGAGLVAAAATGAIGPWGFAGLIFVATSAASRCPLYLPFGLSTCKVPQK